MTSESGVDLGLDDRWCDWGDVDCRGEAADRLRIEQAAAEAWTSARLLALGGNRDSHASPFHRVMEEGLARRLVQVGMRTMNAVQPDAARRFGVECVSPEAAANWSGLHGLDPVYVSIDLDALDPAFAPGVSHHEPGGLTVRELLAALRKVTCPIVGAKFHKELLARLLGT